MKQSLLLSAALLLWGGFLIYAYLKSNLFQNIPYLKEFALLLIFLLLSFGVGSKILKLVGKGVQLNAPASYLFSPALGFGFFSLVTLGLGLLGLLYSEVA